LLCFILAELDFCYARQLYEIWSFESCLYLARWSNHSY